MTSGPMNMSTPEKDGYKVIWRPTVVKVFNSYPSIPATVTELHVVMIFQGTGLEPTPSSWWTGTTGSLSTRIPDRLMTSGRNPSLVSNFRCR